MICVDLIKQRMTLKEAQRNAGEMNRTRSGSDHYAAIEKAIRESNFTALAEILDQERGADTSFTD